MGYVFHQVVAEPLWSGEDDEGTRLEALASDCGREHLAIEVRRSELFHGEAVTSVSGKKKVGAGPWDVLCGIVRHLAANGCAVCIAL